MESLIQWDISLFELINGWNSPFWDEVMYGLSSKWLWIPLYALMLYHLLRTYAPASVFLVVIATALLITFSDQTTSSLLKPQVKRPRPCQLESKLPFEVHRVRDKCGGKYGFASSHAANFFAMATFFSLLFRDKRWSLGLYSAAFLVSYSRIYLGRHYPADVIAGAAIGVLGAWMGYLLIRRQLKPRPSARE